MLKWIGECMGDNTKGDSPIVESGDNATVFYSEQELYTFIEIKYPELTRSQMENDTEFVYQKTKEFLHEATTTGFFTTPELVEKTFKHLNPKLVEKVPELLYQEMGDNDKLPTAAKNDATENIIRTLLLSGNTQTLINLTLFTPPSWENVIIDTLIANENPKINLYLTAMPTLQPEHLYTLWERANLNMFDGNTSELLKRKIISHKNCPKNILTTITIFPSQPANQSIQCHL